MKQASWHWSYRTARVYFGGGVLLSVSSGVARLCGPLQWGLVLVVCGCVEHQAAASQLPQSLLGLGGHQRGPPLCVGVSCRVLCVLWCVCVCGVSLSRVSAASIHTCRELRLLTLQSVTGLVAVLWLPQCTSLTVVCVCFVRVILTAGVRYWHMRTCQ